MPRKQSEIPWLEQHDNGFWYVHWYDAPKKRTKRVSLGTRDPGAAKDKYIEFMQQGEDVIGGVVPPNELTVSAGLDLYYEEHVLKSCEDVERQETAINHLKAHFKQTPFHAVDIPRSREYTVARREGVIGGGSRRKNKTGAFSTIRRELVVLQAAANHAFRWKRLQVNQMPSIELPPEESTDIIWYSEQEIELLLNESDGDLHDFIKLAYYTAARRDSIQNLTAGQVKWDQGLIDLATPGKRRTKKRQAIVPIFDEIRSILTKRTKGASGGDLLFLNSAGGRKDFYRPFTKLATKLGVDGSPHSLRHSRATHQLMKGKNIYDVARLLGDTVQTVERVYGHHSAANLKENLG